MVEVEILDSADKVISTSLLPYVPRIGEYVSIEEEGVFVYYNVVEVWIRISEHCEPRACIRVNLDD